MPSTPGLRDAFVNAFSEDEFDLFLRDEFRFVRQNFIPNKGHVYVVQEVLDYFDRRGDLSALVAAAIGNRPRNLALQIETQYSRLLAGWVRSEAVDDAVMRAYARHNIPVPSVAVREDGASLQTNPLSIVEPGFESRVNQLIPKLQVAEFRQQLFRFESRVCRIEIDSRPTGTGFLVGPDAVLTNYHVIAPARRTAGTPVSCRFGYTVTAGVADPTAAVVDLPPDPEEWLAAYSPTLPAAEEESAFSHPTEEHLAHLDFAVIRLPEPIGGMPVVREAKESPPRGWIPLPVARPAVPRASKEARRSPLMMLQYPGSGTLELTIDTSGLMGLNGNESRVRYTTNSEEGVSGSPCLDMRWGLIALHHFGDPTSARAYNQGIPVHLIRQALPPAVLASLGKPSP
jgi:hypothetical protein